MNIFLTKEQLLTPKREYMELELPELGGSVRLSSYSARAAIGSSDIAQRRENGELVTADMIRLTLSAGIVDADGKPMFTDETVNGLIDALSPATVTKLCEAIGELNAKHREKQLQKKENGELGNSKANPSDAQPSGSASL
jgi:hypothetical protein